MANERLGGIIESILFVCGEAVSLDRLAEALETPAEEIEQAVSLLEEEYTRSIRGLQIKRFANQVQLVSQADYAPYVERVLQPSQRQSLSQSALETLAVVAYRQPVTRQEVEAVRGVKCDYSLQSLAQKNLIRDAGRKETLGRPILYETTDQFLAHFGLSSLKELPPLPSGPDSSETVKPPDDHELDQYAKPSEP